MGCDIHAMKESKETFSWKNEGEPDLGRNYWLFTVMANVRNSYDEKVIPISMPKGVPEDASWEFRAWHKDWDSDAHSPSWLTLAELRAFRPEQEDEDLASLIAELEEVREKRGLTDEDVRVCFFFDN